MVMKKILMIYSAIKNELLEVSKIFQDRHSVNMTVKYSPKEKRQ